MSLLQPERVSGLVVVDVSPAVSPNVNKTPAYLEAMLRISLSFIDANNEDSNSAPMSQVRRQVLEDLAVTVQVSVFREINSRINFYPAGTESD